MTPVKKQLKRYITTCGTNEQYQRDLSKLVRIATSQEWKIVIQLLWTIKNEMAVELLQSANYTKDSAESKDVKQRVYYNISEWIDFLTNPKQWIGKKGMIQILTSKLKGDKPERKES
jgi:hypothetical protein